VALQTHSPGKARLLKYWQDSLFTIDPRLARHREHLQKSARATRSRCRGTGISYQTRRAQAFVL